MFIRRWLGVLIVLLTVVASVSAQESDKLSVVFLRDGDSLTDAFRGDVTAHMFVFNATAGDVVDLNMIGTEKPTSVEEIPDFLDPYLLLLGPRGEFLASDDDSGEGLDASISEFTLPDDGSYFVIATSYRHLNNILIEAGEESSDVAKEFEYTLQIEGIHPPTHIDDYNDESALFFRGDISIDGNPVQGASTEAEPVFYFGMMGEAGQTITITLESDEFDTALHLFDPVGVRVAVNDDDTEGNTTNSAIRNYTLEDDGLYLIFATDIFFYRAGQELEEGRVPFKGGTFMLKVISE